MTESARSLYELRIVDASSVDHETALAKTLLVNLLDVGSGGFATSFPAHVEVLIIDRRTGETVFARHTDPEVARLLAIDIGENLDRLDAVDFAREWGIGVVPSKEPRPSFSGLARVPGNLLRMLFGRAR